jgi:hypothetical protein
MTTRTHSASELRAIAALGLRLDAFGRFCAGMIGALEAEPEDGKRRRKRKAKKG